VTLVSIGFKFPAQTLHLISRALADSDEYRVTNKSPYTPHKRACAARYRLLVPTYRYSCRMYFQVK
jgi:hypothetical protein